MTQIANAILASPGAVAYWPLDEASGNAIDRVGGRVAVASGAGMRRAQPSLLPNGEGACAVFSGANGEYLLTAADAAFILGDPIPYTWEAWVRDDGVAEVNGRRVLTTWTSAPNANGGQSFYHNNLGGNFVLRIKADGTNQAFTFKPAVVPAGEVHHQVITYDGTTVTIYLDGAVVSSAAPAAAMAPSGTGELGIGGTPYSSFNHLGALQEVAIYSVALEAARVRQHYQVGAGLELAPVDVKEVIYRPVAGLDPSLDGSVTYGPKGLNVDLADAIARGGIVTADPYLQDLLDDHAAFKRS